MSTDNSNRRIHLVFGGGGIRALAYIGAVRELQARGYEIASVSGCSAGSIFSALLAASMSIDDIAAVFQQKKRFSRSHVAVRPRAKGLLSTVFPLFGPGAMYATNGVPQFVVNLIGKDLAFSELSLPFATGAVDLKRRKILQLSTGCEGHQDVKVSSAVEMATAVPPLYDAVDFEGRSIVDLAFASNNPAFLALGFPERIPIVLLQCDDSGIKNRTRTQYQSITRVVEAGIASRDHYFNTSIPRLTVVSIRTDVDSMDFNLGDSKRSALIELGAKTMESYLNASRGFPMTQVGEQIREPSNFADWGLWEANRTITEGQREANDDVPRVFISYAREDRPWLRNFLYSWLITTKVPIWRDTLIEPSAKWEEEIKRHIASAEAAVLLVSRHFLESEFIMDKELPWLIDRVRKGDMKLYCIMLEDCDVDSVEAFRDVNTYQAVNRDRPLSVMAEAEWETMLKSICTKIVGGLGGD